MDAALELTQQLVKRPSVSPDDAGCQEILIERLRPLGFRIEQLSFGAVDNLWARRGDEGPLFVFAGHTDVVPVGNLAQWDSDPFCPEIRNGNLYGRGVADMKGSLAAMICATEGFLAAGGLHRGSLAFLITSDEEGPATDGTGRVVDWLQQRGELIDWCVVGEPSSTERLGDTLRNGRRGSLSGHLVVQGIQGHVAYPELARNPIHKALPVLDQLRLLHWDDGGPHFPPTSFQISNLSAGAGAANVIPSELHADFNFRYSTESTEKALRNRVEELLREEGCDYELTWTNNAKPFVTAEGELIAMLRDSVSEVMGLQPRLSTGGGTSDGRFIAPTGAEVAELGLLNPTIHKVNEHAPVADLGNLTQIYQRLLEKLLS